MPNTPELTPRIVVDDPDAILAFYERTLDAEVFERFTDPDGHVVHAAFRVGSQVVTLAQAVPDWGLRSPLGLGGSPCLLHLTLDDPDAVAARMVEAGAQTLIEIADRPYGKREGRIADPAGHLWILSKDIEDLSDEGIRERLGSA